MNHFLDNVEEEECSLEHFPQCFGKSFFVLRVFTTMFSQVICSRGVNKHLDNVEVRGYALGFTP